MSFKLVNQVYRSIDLPSSEKALFAFLAHMARDDGTSIYPGVELMMKAISLQRWQTQKLLRLLKEKGYILQKTSPGDKRTALYRIPLDQFGTITPQPMSAADAAAERAKHTRHQKYNQAKTADLGDDQQEQAIEPRFPAVAAALSTALVPVEPPVLLHQHQNPFPDLPEEATWQDQQQQIYEWQQLLQERQEKRNSYPNPSRGWLMWDKLTREAETELKAWQALSTQGVVPAPQVEGNFAQ